MKRTAGSRSDVGMLYQYGVTALLAAKLSENNHVADYIIYSSEKSAGKFDDIIARIKLTDQDDWCLYLIQVKYKETKRLNVSDNLSAKPNVSDNVRAKRTENFLSDYIQCFNDILNNPNLTCRRGIPDYNIKFSIFCDRGIQTPVFLRQDSIFQLSVCRQTSEKSDVINNVLLPFGNIYWKFVCKDLEKSEFQHFFDKCCLYLEQPNYNKLYKLIEEACQITDTKAIINYVKDYFNDDDLHRQGLSREVFEIELQKMRVIDAIPPFTSFADLTDDNRITIWNEITIKHDITAVNCMQNFDTEPCLYSCLVRKVNSLLDINMNCETWFSKKNYLDNEIIEKFLIYSKTKRLRYWIDLPHTLRSLIIELWKCGDLPLILKTHTQLSNFEKYVHLKRSYIVLDDWTTRSEEISSSNMEIFASLGSIDKPDLQDRMLKETLVSPQGRKPVTLKNLLRDDKELMSAFTCVNILNMMRKRMPFLKEGYFKGSDYLAFIIEDEECAEISDRIEPYAIGHNFRISYPPGQADQCIKMIRGHADIYQHYTVYHLRRTGDKLLLIQGDPQRLSHRFVDQYGDQLFISNIDECIPVIGQSIEPNELQYIPRQLRKVTLAKSFFSSQETQICVLSGDLTFIERSIEFSTVDDIINETILIEKKTYFVKVHEKENRQYYWRKLCNLKYPIVDIYSKDDKLELLRYRNCKNLNLHLSYDGGIYSEQEILNEIRDEADEIAVVTGDAGIGKSSFLKWLCNNYSTQNYIVYYDLINLQVDLHKSERQRIDLIEFIFKETQKGLPKQYRDFVSKLRRKKKLIWVLDSFDEIRLPCENQVLDLIRCIANFGAQIVISTRIENCNLLIDQFDIRLIKIEPLKEIDCLSYWELDQKLLKNVSCELATNPLYLNFLKMISVNQEELVNVTKYTLYEKVINMKVKHCLRATYILLQNSDIEQAVLLLEKLALVAMFGKDLVEKELCWVCDNEVSDMIKFGIVIRFDDDTFPIFYHRSFVEFLFAQWIAKACRIKMYKSAARYFYKKIFNENKLHILNILFENEELHCAILQANIKKINIIKQNAGCWNSIDKLGRTPLHAAVIHCLHSSNSLSKTLMILNFVVTSMLESNLDVDKPDIIMNWNWSEYIQAEIFNFSCGFEMMDVVRIYLRLHRRRIEKDECPSPVFPTQYFHSIFLWALKSVAIDMIADLVLLQNFENKFFYNFYKLCVGLFPERSFSWTESFHFEGQLTPMHIACIHGTVSMVQKLIKIGVNIDVTDAFGCTPLHYSIMRCCLLGVEKNCERSKNIYAVKLLLEAGANPNSVILRINGLSPLHLAVHTKNINVVLMLLKTEANILHRDDNKNTLLHLAVRLGCIDIVQLLLRSGVPQYLKNEQNETPLNIAVKEHHIEMIKLLSEKDDIVDVEKEKMPAVYVGANKYIDANTPLHDAVCCGNIDLIKVLLRKGESINVLNKSGGTPLHTALTIKNVEVSIFLLSKGADIRVRDKYGRTPLLIATALDNSTIIEMILERDSSTSVATSCRWTPLHVAVTNNNSDVVKLLLENGANVNAQDLNDRTPLHFAAVQGYERSVTLLLENGANPKIQDAEGITPLFLSILACHRKISTLLLRKGASANVCDNRGRTPFFLAVFQQDIDTVRLLLENGANVNDVDLNGDTALFLTSKVGNTELTRLLVEKGANVNAQNKDGISVLGLAAHNEQINIIELLLKANVDIDRRGGTVALSCFISRQDINTVRLLLKRGASVNAYDDRYCYTPLLLAATTHNIDIVNLLLENGAHVNANCSPWSSPLHQAVINKSSRIAKSLIDKGADVNAKFEGNRTILHAAIEAREITIVELLLEANADVTKEARLEALRKAVLTGDIKIIKLLLNKGVALNIHNENDDTPLYIATCTKRADIVRLLLENGADANILSRNGVAPFGKAVLDGHIEISRLLLDNGANVHHRFLPDWPALHLKSGQGDVDYVKLLIEKGADVNIITKDGFTALKLAVDCGHVNIVEVLLEERALRLATEDMIKTFYWAAEKGHLKIVKLLLNYGVNVNIQNSSGYTPLHTAVINNNEGIIETLLENGADINLKTNDGFTAISLAELKGHVNITELFTAFMLSLNTL